MRPDNTEYRNYVLDSKGSAILLASFVIVQVVLGAIVGLDLIFFQKNIFGNMFFMMISYILMMLVPIFAFDFFMMRSKGKVLHFNMQTKNAGTYLLIFPMMFGMMLVAEYVTSFIPVTGPFFGKMYDTFSQQLQMVAKDNVGMVIMVSLFAPLLEEILFRGIIQKGMINKGVKPLHAIVISSFVFGAIHLNPWQFVGGFLLGLVLGLVYYKTKSLLLPILLHAFNNFISSVLMIKYNTESFSDILQIADWQLFLCGIALFSVFYYLFMKKYKVHYLEN